ncbi:MAG: prepilin-type N-terminal cleavage/methylation domain-containing protein [Armatimonadota bacterium]|nr:prepilin-type N-terminal cleavage/methylation domain-containing protein [Armatimonadota bacterium]
MRARRHRRGGLTLTELLVAMSILLIGIYAVVRGFPPLFVNIEGERVRTEMAGLCEQWLERLKAEPQCLPEAIAGHDPVDGSVIGPEVWPDEEMTPPEGNARDDLTWVLGETFEVPGPQPASPVSVYPLKLGAASIQDPANVDGCLQVFKLVKLERVPQPPPGGAVPEGRFYLDAAGYLYAPPQYATARVNYCWMDDTATPHWVTDEVVMNSNYAWTQPVLPVRAAELTAGPVFTNVVPEMAEATALVRYSVVIGQAGDVAPDTAVLESTYGATLLLPSEDAGQAMHVNYQLRSEPDVNRHLRRMPVMMEEMAAPTQRPYQVDLKFGGIHDDIPLYDTDVLGNPLPTPARVLVLDLLTGQAWTDVEPWLHLDTLEGTVTLDWEDPTSPLAPADAHGRELRVYYRTLDGHMIAVQKAPAYFLEEPIMQTYQDPDPALDESDKVDYRYFRAQPWPADAAYTQLQFPESAAGQAITVDYLAGTAAPYNRIAGELHVVDAQTLSVVLDQPNVVGIMGVQGVSLTVRGWWHDDAGRPQMVSIDTFLTPEPLL